MAKYSEEDYVAPTPSGTPEQVKVMAALEGLRAAKTGLANRLDAFGPGAKILPPAVAGVAKVSADTTAVNEAIIQQAVAGAVATSDYWTGAVNTTAEINAAQNTDDNGDGGDGGGGGGGGSDSGQKTTTDDPAYAALVARFKALGLGNLVPDIARIRADYPSITSEDLLTLLRSDSRYNGNYLVRFAGNKALMDKGKQMLTEADYLKTESAYEKIFKAYSLSQFMNQGYYAQLIGNEVDSTEVGTRVSLGYNRILHADPETLDIFKKYYPMLSTGDIVGAMLDPKNQLPELERKVTSAEVGGAALAQGLNAFAAATTVKNAMYSNVTSGTIGSEAAVAAGENLTQAKADYEKIAGELPRAEFLSSITPQMAQYGQVEAEQANILGLASAKRKKESLIAAEAARMMGQAGTYGSKSFSSGKGLV